MQRATLVQWYIMKLLDFFANAIQSEESAVNFLRLFGLFDPTIAICPGKSGAWCKERMMEIKKKNRKGKVSLAWRCTKGNCRATKSIRNSNRFFAFLDAGGRSHGKISLCQILLIIYFFIYSKDTIDQFMIKTGHSNHTIVDWLNFCREVCSKVIQNQPKMVGTLSRPVQIDEAYFQGRRKYGRGRMRNGDLKRKNEKKEKQKMKEIEKVDYELGRVVGPWVFGLYLSSERFRFYVVHNRTADTLIPLVQENVTDGSLIVSDEWAAYNRLEEEGYDHETVNHSNNYVNPETGYHTQAIERVWKEGKAWLHRARHAGPYLQNHLDEVSWRHLRRNHPNGLIGAFLEDVHYYFSCELE